LQEFKIGAEMSPVGDEEFTWLSSVPPSFYPTCQGRDDLVYTFVLSNNSGPMISNPEISPVWGPSGIRGGGQITGRMHGCDIKLSDYYWTKTSIRSVE
jgi:hypothetical protein